MKNILLITLLLTFNHFLNGQLIDGDYTEFTLIRDAPSHLPEGIKSFDNVKFGTLETGVDSLLLTFGTYTENGRDKCFAHLKNGKSWNLIRSYLESIDSSNIFSIEMDFDIIPYTKKVSFYSFE